MADAPSFHTLLRQVRAGDDSAAAVLVQEYLPAIQRFIRLRLTDPTLRRTVDSADICQSVLANFFVRLRTGQFDLDDRSQLLALLTTMAKNKITDLARKQRAARRDVRRLAPAGQAAAEVAPDQATPSSIVAARELLQQVRSRLTEDERWLADQRSQGRAWAEIAADRQQQPDALRMQLTRALNRVAAQLDIDEVHHE